MISNMSMLMIFKKFPLGVCSPQIWYKKIGNIWPTFLLLIFLLIHGLDAKAILREDGIYLANLRGTQNVVIGLLVSKIYPDKKIGNLFNRAEGKRKSLEKSLFFSKQRLMRQ